MATQTSLIAQQVRIRQWAEQIRACQNRPAGMDVDTGAYRTISQNLIIITGSGVCVKHVWIRYRLQNPQPL